MVKFLIILFLIFFFIYQVTKLLFRPLFFFAGGKDRNSGFGQRPTKKSEGELSIDFIPEKKKHTPKNAGEYVDYEEVDEK